MSNLKKIKSSALIEFTEKDAQYLRKEIAKFDVKEISADNGTFRVIMTTEKKDRDGEVIKLDGWQFDNYMKNPVVLYGHNYWGLENIIGRVDKITREGDKYIAEGKFASQDANPKAQMVRRLYDEKIVQSVSVGFIVKGRDPVDNSIITAAELIELSFVPVPANPEAVDILKAFGLSDMVRKDTDIEDDKDTDADEGGDKTNTLDAKMIADALKGLSDIIEGLVNTVKTIQLALDEKAQKEKKDYEQKEFLQTLSRAISEKLRDMKQ